jgi:hypothetical protein
MSQVPEPEELTFWPDRELTRHIDSKVFRFVSSTFALFREHISQNSQEKHCFELRMRHLIRELMRRNSTEHSKTAGKTVFHVFEKVQKSRKRFETFAKSFASQLGGGTGVTHLRLGNVFHDAFETSPGLLVHARKCKQMQGRRNRRVGRESKWSAMQQRRWIRRRDTEDTEI